MNRIKVIIVAVLLLVLVGCTVKNDNSTSKNDVSEQIVAPSVAESSPESVEKNDSSKAFESSAPTDFAYEENKLFEAVQHIIQQYKDGSVDTKSGSKGASAPDFGEQPDDFQFPEMDSIDDLYSVEAIDGWEDTLIVKVMGTGENPAMTIWVETKEDYRVSSVLFLID